MTGAVSRLEGCKHASVAAVLMASLLSAGPVLAQEWGVRAGSGEGVGAIGLEVRRPAPRLQAYMPAGVEPHWELSLARWRRSGDTMAVAALGPALGYPLTRSLRLSLGVRPTWLSAGTIDGEDLGGRAHLTSHIGGQWRVRPAWVFEARFQHTSNAGLGSPNPGVNLVNVGLSYRY